MSGDREDALKRLEDWWNSTKGHYVNIDADTTYGAVCWNVTLGDVNLTPREDWFVEADERNRAKIFASECSFWESKEPIPPNIVFANTDDADPFVGLAATIHVAIDKAEEFGFGRAQRYRTWNRRWHEETQISSASDHNHPHFVAALAEGKGMIPFAVEDLRKEPNWFAIMLVLALTQMETDNETERGRLQVLTDKIIAWYDDKNPSSK